MFGGTRARYARTCALGVLALSASAQGADWTVTFELPGVLVTTASVAVAGSENFNLRPTGTDQTFVSSFGGSAITGHYSSTDVLVADLYGGAGGLGRYAAGSGMTLQLSEPVRFFGYWLSAIEGSNVLSFYDGTDLVGEFNVGTLFNDALGSDSRYLGNPNRPFLGQNPGEAYAFVNFRVVGMGDQFDQIQFFGSHESDNHTIGIAVVPEPGTALLLAMGVTVFGCRRRWGRITAE